jgi:hypothetical protein
VRADLPKFTSGNRMTGTPDETNVAGIIAISVVMKPPPVRVEEYIPVSMADADPHSVKRVTRSPISTQPVRGSGDLQGVK